MNRAEHERLVRVFHDRQSPAVAARYADASPPEAYATGRRARAIRELLRRHGWPDLAAARVLDVGCGRGPRLLDWTRWGVGPANLAGVDIVEEFVTAAAAMVPEAVLAVAAGDELPFADATFDVVAQFTVFTSILDPALRHCTAREMRRVVRPGGLILWYDIRVDNPFNRNVRGIGRAELASLFPGCPIDLCSITLLPPVARLLGRCVYAVGELLERAPILRTHYLAAISNP